MGGAGGRDGAAVGITSARIIDHLMFANSQALLADGLEQALIGYSMNHHMTSAVYDADKCVLLVARRLRVHARRAAEILEESTFGAYVGSHGPVFARIYK